MRKISESIDDFFDNIYISIAEYLSPYFYNLNYTPNHITSLSIICGIISVYFYLNHDVIFGTIFYFLTYLFDVIDGFYARKYKMETLFGDKYDHYTDYIFFIIFSFIFVLYTNIKYKKLFIFGYILLSLTTSVHLGCTEQFFNKDATNTELSKLKYICPNPNKLIHIIKWLGPGTFVTYTSIFILIFGNKK